MSFDDFQSKMDAKLGRCLRNPSDLESMNRLLDELVDLEKRLFIESNDNDENESVFRKLSIRSDILRFFIYRKSPLKGIVEARRLSRAWRKAKAANDEEAMRLIREAVNVAFSTTSQALSR